MDPREMKYTEGTTVYTSGIALLVWLKSRRIRCTE